MCAQADLDATINICTSSGSIGDNIFVGYSSPVPIELMYTTVDSQAFPNSFNIRSMFQDARVCLSQQTRGCINSSDGHWVPRCPGVSTTASMWIWHNHNRPRIIEDESTSPQASITSARATIPGEAGVSAEVESAAGTRWRWPVGGCRTGRPAVENMYGRTVMHLHPD